ncbi:MAG: hypothetical protein JO092_11560 [Candidatus Eremiobacteraeota bacterium]|nr:hypothetical protein [Candidatus Eremiobacteraeota bacterium]
MGNAINRVSAGAALATILCIATAVVSHAVGAADVADFAGTCAYFALVLSVVASIAAAWWERPRTLE